MEDRMIHCHSCGKEVLPEIQEVRIFAKQGGVAILEVVARYSCECGTIRTITHSRMVEVL